MPLYTAITAQASISDVTKAKIAEEVTRIHAVKSKQKTVVVIGSWHSDTASQIGEDHE